MACGTDESQVGGAGPDLIDEVIGMILGQRDLNGGIGLVEGGQRIERGPSPCRRSPYPP
jgi:hypothetical protein